MMWVDCPPNGLPPGYYPIEGAPQNDTGSRQKAASKEHAPGRITEVRDVAYIDIVSSAAENMTIGKDVVKYVNAFEDVYIAERRKRPEGDAGDSEAPLRQRGRQARAGSPARVTRSTQPVDSEIQSELPAIAVQGTGAAVG